MGPSAVVTPLMFEHQLVDRARAADTHIVLPEGEEERILVAADQLLRRGVARLTLLGQPETVAAKAQRLQLDLGRASVLDPVTDPLRERFAHELSGVVAEQQRVIDALTAETKRLRDRVIDEGQAVAPAEKPPHY